MTSELTNWLTDQKLRATRWWDSDLVKLRQVVSALNGQNTLLTKHDHSALVGFVQVWNRSGRKILHAQARFPKRFSIFNLERAWRWKLLPREKNLGDANENAKYVLSATGLDWIPEQKSTDMAVVFASLLITNPLRMKLSDGPCQRPACQRWFIKKRENQLACSRRCLGVVNSGERNKEVRAQQRKDKLYIARDWIAVWKAQTEKERSKFRDWIEFVEVKSKKSKEVVTRKFITRAVNDKELKPPKEKN